MPFRTPMLFHPTFQVQSLPEANAWYRRVLDLESVPGETFMAHYPFPDGYALDYCIFTRVGDVLLDTLDPSKHLLDGEQLYPSIERPRLAAFGWYVDGMEDLYERLADEGIGCEPQHGVTPEPGETPRGLFGEFFLYWARPADAGLRYQFFDNRASGNDFRNAPGWRLGSAENAGALGVEMCSHHTVLTEDKGRALRLYLDVLGGEVIEEAENRALEAASTYIHLAGSTYELATPAEGSGAARALAREPEDCYHSIAWKVADLDLAARHLEREGIRLELRTDELVVTAAEDSLGVPWVFSASLVAGDPRS